MRGLPRSATVAVSFVLLLVPACAAPPAAVSHGGPVRDQVSLIDALRARDVTVDIVGATRQPALRPPGTALQLSGGDLRSPVAVESYNYDPTDLGPDAEQVARTDATGLARVSQPTHVFLKDRVLVLYAGTDPTGLAVLADLLGAAVTGRTSP